MKWITGKRRTQKMIVDGNTYASFSNIYTINWLVIKVVVTFEYINICYENLHGLKRHKSI
jgi:hypothetical protein